MHNHYHMPLSNYVFRPVATSADPWRVTRLTTQLSWRPESVVPPPPTHTHTCTHLHLSLYLSVTQSYMSHCICALLCTPCARPAWVVQCPSAALAARPSKEHNSHVPCPLPPSLLDRTCSKVPLHVCAAMYTLWSPFWVAQMPVLFCLPNLA